MNNKCMNISSNPIFNYDLFIKSVKVCLLIIIWIIKLIFLSVQSSREIFLPTSLEVVSLKLCEKLDLGLRPLKILVQD